MKLPYERTAVSVEKSQRGINDLLYKYNVTKISWASEKDVFLQLIFVIPKGDFDIPVRIRLPFLTKPTRTGSKQLPEASYRMLYYYIKAKLEAVRYGIEAIEEAFMPHIAIDNKRTLKDVVIDQLPKMLPAPEE
jgi:hypothetical protein